MNKMLLIFSAVALGIILPIQAALNGKMMRTFNHPILGAAISFATGTLFLLAYAFTLRKNITIEAIKETSWYDWTGGLMGVIYVTGVIILIPRLGAGFAFALIVGGQLLMSVVMDHYGLLGLPINQISWIKIVGGILIILGVWLIRSK